MKWTDAQRETIETRNRNILVSAAAGSGKTAVLIERIKQLVIEDKTDIDRFLITTFTNATSAEMKARLEKAIREQLEVPGADRTFLKRQLSMLPGANISTFHTFALEVMKRYFYLTDLEPGFRIGDETEISIMKNEAAGRLFEERFENDYGAFSAFLRKYSGDRNEKRIKKNVIAVYDEMRSIPDYMKWARESAGLLNSASPSEAMKLTEFVIREAENGLAEAGRLYGMAAEVLDEAGIDSLSEKAYDDAETVENLAKNLRAKETYSENIELFTSSLQNMRLNQMRASKDQQEDYAEIKDHVSDLRKRGKKVLDDLKKKFFARPPEEYDAELRDSYEDTRYLVGIIEDFERIFREMKADRGMIDFDDVMHYAIDILRDDMAAAEYREKFRYIFIDEFQDSNMLQETIVARIARPNNLFMVGDVKQSIYKFRLAEPEIFEEKYKLYAMESEAESIKIDLNSNFRSKSSVTGTVNSVFEQMMDDYDDKASLRCTIDSSHPGMASELHIVDGGSRDEDHDKGSDEGRLIAELIRGCAGKEIYDVKKGTNRKAEYRDIVVLCRSRSSINRLERFLTDEGIAAYGDDTGEYFETIEVQVFVNLLRIIDNTRQDIPLISAMRSPVFDFDVREMAEIRIAEREGSFYDAVRAFAERDDTALAKKVRDMLETVSRWKEQRKILSLEELTRTLLYDTGYFDYCSGLPMGDRRTANLQMLVEKAGQFEQNNYSGLYGFISYIEAMKESNISIGEAKTLGEGENVVRVMTVHKSKGLEFPVVILADTGKTIRHRGSGTGIIMHKDLSLALPHVDTEGLWHRKTLLQRVIDAKKAEEEYEEEIRILYVAMTRAMDQLIMTGTVRDPAKLGESQGKKSSFMEMVYVPMKENGEFVELHEGVSLEESHEEERDVSRLRIAGLLEKAGAERDANLTDAIDRKLSYVYPYGEAAGIKSKYSVTELGRSEALGEADSRPEEGAAQKLARPEFAGGATALTAARTGTAMHLIMEKTDFRMAAEQGRGYIERVAAGLHEDGLLTDDDMKAVDIGNIEAFFAEETGRRAAASDSLHKESEFISLREIGDSEVIVQGIIDCYFEEADGIVLIDYKNSRVAGERGEKDIAARYEGQIRMYGEALEEALGKKVKEAYLYLFEMRKFIPMDIR